MAGFRVDALLGRGAFAQVVAAQRLDDGARVALKVAAPGQPQAQAQLAAEARALAAIGAPAVPALLGEARSDAGSLVLVLERIQLPTLASLLGDRQGPVTAEEFGPLADAALAALEAIHWRGWAHLDFKPENLLIGGEPKVGRLVDLGLAQRALGEVIDVPGQVAGTPDYMAPEQIGGQRAGLRADVYAAGVVLFELLTGRTPFFGNADDVRRAHQALRPPRPSSLAPVAPAVEEVVLRCLAKDPALRFGTAAGLRQELGRAIAEGGRAPAVDGPQPARAEAQEKRKAALVFALSSAGLATLQQAFAAAGGALAHAARGRVVAVFEASAVADPVERALGAATSLIERGVLERARVDVVQVALQRRGGGPPRYLSTTFSQEERFPSRADPAGPSLTRAAVEALPARNLVPSTGGVGLWRVSQTSVALGGDPQQESGPLLGRGDLVGGLLDSARRAAALREPSVAVVLGDAGVGKSHLGAALAARLRAELPEAQVIALRLREPMAGLAEEALRALFLAALDLSPAPATELARERLTAALGPAAAQELWPAVALGLGVADLEDARLRTLRAAPGALRTLSVRALGEALRRCAADRPLCVILDDTHFADDTALDALEYAALAEAAAPLWICAIGRPGFERARRRFGERARHRRTDRLEPLTPEASTELCRALLLPAENTPAEAIAKLVQRTQGLPLLLVELVRGLKREGWVRRKSRGTGWYLATEGLDALPELPLIDWLAQRELSTLAPDLAAHARLIALLGPEFTAPEVDGVIAELERERAAGEFPLDVRVGNQRLVTSGLLSAGQRGSLRFRHALVRDAVALTVPAALRHLIHRAAARYYRALGSAPTDRLALLAWHASLADPGSEPTPLRLEAAAIYLQMAERARVRHAYLEAETTYTRALDLLPEVDVQQRLVAHRGRGDTRFRIGRSEGSLEDFGRARLLAAEAGRPEAEVETLLDEATARDWLGDFARSQTLVEEARALSDQLSDQPLLAARLLMGEGRARFRAGRWDLASAALEAAAQQAEPLGNAGYETLVASLIMLEVVLPMLGRIDDAGRVAERAVALASERQDQLHLASALNNRRNLLIARRDLGAAVADQQRFMRIGRDLGIVLSEYYGEFNLGELLYYAGEFEPAEVHARRAMQIETDHPEVAPRPVATLLLARQLAFRGREAEARELAAGLSAHGAHQPDTDPAVALAPSDQVLLRAVELSTRACGQEELEALVADSRRDSIEQEPIEVLELLAAGLSRRRDLGGARALLEQASVLSATLPNILEGRVRQGLTALAQTFAS